MSSPLPLTTQPPSRRRHTWLGRYEVALTPEPTFSKIPYILTVLDRYAIANTLIGVVLFFIILASGLHYTNTWYADFLPISDSSTYDNTGSPYNVTRVITKDFTLSEEAYKAYSPLFLSTTFALTYGLSFAAIASLIVYTYLHHRKTIWLQYKNATNEAEDIHMKLMRKYVEAPTWWYMILFAIVSLSTLTAPSVSVTCYSRC